MHSRQRWLRLQISERGNGTVTFNVNITEFRVDIIIIITTIATKITTLIQYFEFLLFHSNLVSLESDARTQWIKYVFFFRLERILCRYAAPPESWSSVVDLPACLVQKINKRGRKRNDKNPSSLKKLLRPSAKTEKSDFNSGCESF